MRLMGFYTHFIVGLGLSLGGIAGCDSGKKSNKGNANATTASGDQEGQKSSSPAPKGPGGNCLVEGVQQSLLDDDDDDDNDNEGGNTGGGGSNNPPPGSLPTGPITYYGHIKKIMESRCVGCHSATASANVRHSPYLTSYTLVRQAAQESYSEMLSGSMPIGGGLAAGDLGIMYVWLKQNTPEGMPSVSPPPAPTPAPGTPPPTPAPGTPPSSPPAPAATPPGPNSDSNTPKSLNNCHP